MGGIVRRIVVQGWSQGKKTGEPLSVKYLKQNKKGLGV
jgi:hypothetical protein